MHRMRTKYLLLTPVVTSFALLGTACAPPAVDLAAAESSIRARSDSVIAAEKAQDAERASGFYHENAVILPAGAPVMNGRAAMREMYVGMFSSGMVKSFESGATKIEVAASGDLAYEYGFNRMTLNTPVGEMLDVGKYLAVWKQHEGQWYVASLAFNSDTPAPVPVAAPAPPTP